MLHTMFFYISSRLAILDSFLLGIPCMRLFRIHVT